MSCISCGAGGQADEGLTYTSTSVKRPKKTTVQVDQRDSDPGHTKSSIPAGTSPLNTRVLVYHIIVDSRPTFAPNGTFCSISTAIAFSSIPMMSIYR
jgi:hypothetical protein